VQKIVESFKGDPERINHPSISGKDTALTVAAKLRHHALKFAKYLVDHKADVNKARGDGQSPLIRAVLGHNPTVAEKLLNDGANINHIDKYHFTPLRWAIEVDDMEMIRLLLARGADPNLADWYDKTPLFRLVEKKRLQMLVDFLEELKRRNIKPNINRPNRDGVTPLGLSLTYFDQRYTAALVGHEAPVAGPSLEKAAGSTSPLVMAVRHNFDEGLLLKDAEASISASIEEAVTGKSHAAICSMLDENGRDVLWWAAYHGQESLVKFLLNGYIRLVKHRVPGSEQCNPHQPDLFGVTPLRAALFTKKSRKVIRELYLADDPNMGDGPLLSAFRFDNTFRIIAELFYRRSAAYEGTYEEFVALSPRDKLKHVRLSHENYLGSTPLPMALRLRDAHSFSFLLGACTKGGLDGEVVKALYYAAAQNYVPEMEEILTTYPPAAEKLLGDLPYKLPLHSSVALTVIDGLPKEHPPWQTAKPLLVAALALREDVMEALLSPKHRHLTPPEHLEAVLREVVLRKLPYYVNEEFYDQTGVLSEELRRRRVTLVLPGERSTTAAMANNVTADHDEEKPAPAAGGGGVSFVERKSSSGRGLTRRLMQMVPFLDEMRQQKESMEYKNRMAILQQIFESPLVSVEPFFKTFNLVVTLCCLGVYVLWVVGVFLLPRLSSWPHIDLCNLVPFSSDHQFVHALKVGAAAMIGHQGTIFNWDLTLIDRIIHWSYVSTRFVFLALSVLFLFYVERYIHAFMPIFILLGGGIFRAIQSFCMTRNAARTCGMDLIREGTDPEEFWPQDLEKIEYDPQYENKPEGTQEYYQGLTKAQRVSLGQYTFTVLVGGTCAFLQAMAACILRLVFLDYAEFYRHRYSYTSTRDYLPLAICMEVCIVMSVWLLAFDLMKPLILTVLSGMSHFRLMRHFLVKYNHEQLSDDYNFDAEVQDWLQARQEVLDRMKSRASGLNPPFQMLSAFVLAALGIMVCKSLAKIGVLFATWTTFEGKEATKVHRGDKIALSLEIDFYWYMMAVSGTLLCITVILWGGWANDLASQHWSQLSNAIKDMPVDSDRRKTSERIYLSIKPEDPLVSVWGIPLTGVLSYFITAFLLLGIFVAGQLFLIHLPMQ